MPTAESAVPSKKALGKRKRSETNAESMLNRIDADKLVTVLGSLDHTLLHAESSSPDWTYKTLHEALKADPPASFDMLRSILSQIVDRTISALPKLPDQLPPSQKPREPEEQAVFDSIWVQRTLLANNNQARTESVQAWFLQTQKLLDELQYGREKGTRGLLPPIEDDDVQVGKSSLVALHRMAGGTADIYTSATRLLFDKNVVAALSNSMDTDISTVDQRSIHNSNRLNPSNLGGSNLRPVPPQLRHPSSAPNYSSQSVKPVRNLCYDAFSSFAPTHDSSTSQHSYYSSMRFLNSQHQLEAYESEMIDVLDEALEQPGETVVTQPSTSKSLTLDIAPHVSSLVNMTQEELISLLDSLPTDFASLKVKATLSANAQRLRKLQIAQWERLRQAVISKKMTGDTIFFSESVTQEESDTAAAVLSDLTHVLLQHATSLPPSSLIASPTILKQALTAPQFLPQQGNAITYRGAIEDAANLSALKESELTKVGYTASVKRSRKPRAKGRAFNDLAY